MESILNNEGPKSYPGYKDSGVPWLGEVPECERETGELTMRNRVFPKNPVSGCET